jgi:thiamine biosynthesis protein ThiS
MKITVNGEERELPPGATVAGLIAHFSLQPKKVAIERNREIVPRSLYDDTALAQGDVVEIVSFVGGG